MFERKSTEFIGIQVIYIDKTRRNTGRENLRKFHQTSTKLLKWSTQVYMSNLQDKTSSLTKLANLKNSN